MAIPNGTILLAAELVREGPDLLLIGPDGDRVLIQGYFTLAEPPVLMKEGGAMMRANLVAPGQYGIGQTEFS